MSELVSNNLDLTYHRSAHAAFAPKYASVLKRISRGSKILEVGCHTGYLTKVLVDQGYETTGIDYNTAAIEHAKKLSLDARVVDIENPTAVASIKEKFDLILVLDVLEHTREPATVLKNLSELLAKNGRFLITAPNVAYWAVRKDLLLGRWNYRDAGILDRTHLRFYSSRSWQEMIQTAGFRITHFSAADGMLPLEHLFLPLPFFGRTVARLRTLALKAFPSLFAIDFLIECSPNA